MPPFFVNQTVSGTRPREVKSEPSSMFFGSQTANDSKAGLVSIAITLNPAAAEVSAAHGLSFDVRAMGRWF